MEFLLPPSLGFLSETRFAKPNLPIHQTLAQCNIDALPTSDIVLNPTSPNDRNINPDTLTKLFDDFARCGIRGVHESCTIECADNPSSDSKMKLELALALKTNARQILNAFKPGEIRNTKIVVSDFFKFNGTNETNQLIAEAGVLFLERADGTRQELMPFKTFISKCDVRDLSELDLSNLDLNGVNLSQRYMAKTILTGTKLNDAILNETDFNDCILSHTQLERASAICADFTNATLENANLKNANLFKTLFVRANLRNANLVEADMTYAELNRANLANAKVSFAKLTGAGLTYSYLSGADLVSTDLQDANLTRAFMEEVNLTVANLSGATLAGAYMNGADMSGTIMHKMNLERTNFSGVLHINDADITLNIPYKWRPEELQHLFVKTEDVDSDTQGNLLKAINTLDEQHKVSLMVDIIQSVKNSVQIGDPILKTILESDSIYEGNEKIESILKPKETIEDLIESMVLNTQWRTKPSNVNTAQENK